MFARINAIRMNIMAPIIIQCVAELSNQAIPTLWLQESRFSFQKEAANNTTTYANQALKNK